MKVIAVIPARYASTRFPGKLMADLNGKPVIQHTYENVINTGLFSEVIIATDDKRIYDCIINSDGKAVMTSVSHTSGTDRIAEVSRNMTYDIIVNVQGDEPLISREPLFKLISAFNDPDVKVASLKCRLSENSENPNIVKVVCNEAGYAMYFSRSIIPYYRDDKSKMMFWRHIGVYAFRKALLEQFISLPVSELESIEKLEQLRLLENGIPIKMVETDYDGFGIDTHEDLSRLTN
jgi:3-deoxy-manno-octulosonate cytidylyltransferase (CMP-KDO synthetase)